MKKFKKFGQNGDISILLIILVVILLALGIGFYVWQKNSNKPLSSDSSSQPAVTPTSTDSPPAKDKEESVCKDPSANVVENVEASVTSGNTAALEGYMASKVMVILAASEGIGERTPAQAVGDVTDFIGDPTTTTWDFDLSAAVLNAYGQGDYKKYFPKNAVVGKASSSKVISFSFDCDGKINTVFESATADIL